MKYRDEVLRDLQDALDLLAQVKIKSGAEQMKAAKARIRSGRRRPGEKSPPPITLPARTVATPTPASGGK